MYTVLENARIVIALLKKHNIHHIVLSPGGSNIPIVQGVQQDPFFTCYSVVDERSAMYFALGIYLQTGEPVATSCTSAQATRNYLPGLTEAYYKRAPILAITMSKHPKHIGQDYMQCPVQTSLPVDSVKRSYSLPVICNGLDRALCVRTANEAILELTHHGKGPVQLNIEELDNLIFELDEGIVKLPDVRAIYRYSYPVKLNSIELTGKKIMILIGEHLPFTEKETKAIEDFSNSWNCVIYKDHTSNYSGKYAVNGNPLVASITQALFEEKYCPDIVITIGGLTGDYPIHFKLASISESKCEHWRVAVDGDVVDTYDKLTRIYELPIEDFFSGMTSSDEVEHSYYDNWKEGVQMIKYNMDIPLSNLYAAIKLHDQIPPNSYMNYAILSSLRVWSFVDIHPTIKAFSNLAAFGIDGCMSTAFGESVGTNELSFLITGDLAFYYDMNALGIRHLKSNVRILLCNNNGGMEFKFGDLPSKTNVADYIAADNHFKNCEGWAKTNGFHYIAIRNKDEFDNSIEDFISYSEKPIIMEVFTNPDNEKRANGTFLKDNWKGTPSETFEKDTKNIIKNFIGESGIKIIKKLKGNYGR